MTMIKFNPHLAKEHILKAHPDTGKDTFQIHGIEAESLHAECPTCQNNHFLHYYIQKGKITHYYCKITKTWINDIPFLDF